MDRDQIRCLVLALILRDRPFEAFGAPRDKMFYVTAQVDVQTFEGSIFTQICLLMFVDTQVQAVFIEGHLTLVVDVFCALILFKLRVFEEMHELRRRFYAVSFGLELSDGLALRHASAQWNWTAAVVVVRSEP